MIKLIKNKGLGILADKNYKKGEIIEKCHLVFIPIKQEKILKKTIFDNYIFEYNKNFDVLALGSGCLYNNSFDPNIEFNYDFKNRMIIFSAIKNIKKGEELCFEYCWDKKQYKREHII